MLESIIKEEITITNLAIIIGVGLILGLIIAIVHKNTTKTSKNFLITLTILPLLVAIVMLMVNGNLGTSIAVLGAFSLVRFRSLPGTSKEIISIFFAMGIGLALGMGQIGFAVIMTLIISIILIVLETTKLLDNKEKNKKLIVSIPENLDYETIFDDVFEKYNVLAVMQKVKTTNMGSMFEISYDIKFNEKISEKEFLDDIRIRNGNLKIVLTHPMEETEL